MPLLPTHPAEVADLPPIILIMVTDAASAERWLRALRDTGYAWNPDDPADTVGNSPTGRFVRTFADDAAREMELRMAAATTWLDRDHVYSILNGSIP